MAKKEESGFSVRKILQDIAGAVLGEGVRALADEVKEKITETMQLAHQKIEETIKHAIKLLALYVIIFIGFVFVLVGFARYLSETVAALDHGLGYVLVGLALVLMGLFASWTSK